MKLPRLGRRCVLALAMFALACAVTKADEPRTPGESAPHSNGHLYYSEPGPTVEATRDFDGVTEQVETLSEWRPMCGSDVGDMTPAQFAEFVANLKAAAANSNFEVLDNPAPHGGGLNIVFAVSGAPAAATTAIAAVETYLEALFADPITVNLTISFQNLGGGGVLGSTQSISTNTNYSAVRNGLINGQDGDDTLQDFLPVSSVPVKFNGSSATVTNVSTIRVNTANYRAAIGTIGTNPDANMFINTNFAFDFDPSNGISGTCFRSVLIHEVFHALGFVSQGDGTGTGIITTLDAFRFRRTAENPANTTDFTSFNRAVWTSNPIADDVNSDFISAEYRMSWGNGSWQASHWRDQGGAPDDDIGIMNPAISGGVTWAPNYLQTSDLAAMDAIGWDYPAVIVDNTDPTPNPMLFNNVPSAVNDQSITMMSVIATDTQNNSITYFFDYVGVLPGANDSAWQGSIIYTDTGLTENTSYSYRVKARDSASTPNETLYSATASAITHMIAPTGVNVSNVGATTANLTAAGTFTNLNLGSSGLFFNWVLTSGGVDVGNSGWTQVNSHNVTGLTPDTHYTFRAKARNQNSVETSTNQSIPFRTLAITPAAPTTNASGTIDVNPNGNPATVMYAIQCVSTIPNDPAWLNKWVAFDGTAQAFEEFLTDADWGVRSLSGLTNGVTYEFAVKAVNSDFVETPLGPPASLTTGGTTVHADCNGDGVFNAVTDTACFVDVLIGVNVDSGAITRSDVNSDTTTNGLDIAFFVDCALTGCP